MGDPCGNLFSALEFALSNEGYDRDDKADDQFDSQLDVVDRATSHLEDSEHQESSNNLQESGVELDRNDPRSLEVRDPETEDQGGADDVKEQKNRHKDRHEAIL